MSSPRTPALLDPVLAERLESVLEFVLRLGSAVVEAARVYKELEPEIAGYIHEVSSQSRLVPMSRMSFPEVLEVGTIYRAQGPEAAIECVERHYAQIFAGAAGLAAIERDWARNPRLTNRMHILRQVLEGHRLELYALTQPALLAQAEGYVAEIVQHKGLLKGSTYRDYAVDLADGEPWAQKMIAGVYDDKLLTQFRHGDPIPPLSRHAIQHGADTTYPTRENSEVMIILFDHLHMITMPEA